MSSVNLTKRVVMDNGPRFVPVVYSANGKIKPDYVLIGGKSEYKPEGTYYLDWYEGKTRKRAVIGEDAGEANRRKLIKQAELNAVAHGLILLPPELTQTPQPPSKLGPSIQFASEEFLKEIRSNLKPSTIASYTTAMTQFLTCLESGDSKKVFVTEIDRKDLLAYKAFLRDKHDEASTAKGKITLIKMWLNIHGVTGIMRKHDMPKPVLKEVEIYEPEELQELLRTCTALERMYWEFFLNTGEREQEVMYTCWSDIDYTSQTPSVTVTGKSFWDGWTPKAYKERRIPISLTFAQKLKAFKPTQAGPRSLLFPTTGNKAKGDFLHCLKGCVRRAEMNCNVCEACIARQECSHWWLHKFRATFACMHLEPTPERPGVTLATMRDWLGHSEKDFKSTARYVRKSKDASTRNVVNTTFAAFD